MIDSRNEEIALNIIYGYRCNYSCDGCCVGSDYVVNKTKDPDLDKTLESIKLLPNIIKIKDSDDFFERGMITLLGGEPMKYWDDRIEPLAREIRKQFPRARLNIFSNGHLLYKQADKIINLIDELSASITISKHLSGDLESPLGKQWQVNIQKFLNHPRLAKIHDDHYEVVGNIESNIHFYAADEWFTWYKKTANGIKPYATNNPEKSMQYGCASGAHCSSLFENRLYKCSSLAMLPGLLSYQGQSHDTDWEKYLDYPYVDLLDVSKETTTYHADNYGKPTTYCDMCNDQQSNIIQWQGRKSSQILRGT